MQKQALCAHWLQLPQGHDCLPLPALDCCCWHCWRCCCPLTSQPEGALAQSQSLGQGAQALALAQALGALQAQQQAQQELQPLMERAQALAMQEQAPQRPLAHPLRR